MMPFARWPEELVAGREEFQAGGPAASIAGPTDGRISIRPALSDSDSVERLPGGGTRADPGN
jgi:hypothetical protein